MSTLSLCRFDNACADPEFFVRGGPISTAFFFFFFFFFFDEGRDDLNTTITPFKCWPNIASLFGNFVIFRGPGPELLGNYIVL